MNWSVRTRPTGEHFSYEGGHCPFTVADYNGRVIASVHQHHGKEEAHARLLARAPDLLRELEAMTNYLKQNPAPSPKERQLIDRAEDVILPIKNTQ